MRGKLLSPLIFLSILSAQSGAIAHGVRITHQVAPALEIQARYDNGENMANAQVAVYAPNDPLEPWLTGTTDAAGRFVFIPDRALDGNWEIQVRQAGHGNIVSVSPEAMFATSDTINLSDLLVGTSPGLDSDTKYTPPQMVLMGASGVWGFVGTALFFIRRRG
ncbi:MAG: carboxypeptidase regulatory-like domain-containing protein [Leptolyngbyaceae cyanobacterium MO_188.B28]|nr:carboxypeptidase regulatory-like domain-containing protein [Leptolyngbyaceae cyanobacterium MO_188.B28]